MLVGGVVSLGVGFEVSVLFSLPPICGSDRSCQLLLWHSVCLSVAMLFAMMVMDLSPENVLKFPIKCSFYALLWSWRLFTAMEQ